LTLFYACSPAVMEKWKRSRRKIYRVEDGANFKTLQWLKGGGRLLAKSSLSCAYESEEGSDNEHVLRR
jgi:hypothetical protein